MSDSQCPEKIQKKNCAELWQPTEEEYLIIRQLAELGWPSSKIAEALEISPQQFAGGLVREPRVKTEYELGVENCKVLPDRRLTWRPMPSDLKRVEMLAANGLREVEIAARLGVSRKAFLKRMDDTPQLRDSFETGEGLFCAKLIDDSEEMLKSRDPSLKYTAGIMIFKLRAYCGLNDKTEAKQLMAEGKIQRRHVIGIGRDLAVPSLPHHRTSGSAYGGSAD